MGKQETDSNPLTKILPTASHYSTKWSCLKAGFHMITDDRKESCFHIIADDRRLSPSRLFGRRKCQNYKREIIAANNMSDVEKELLLQANLFLLLVLKRHHRQLQNRRKHRFRVRRIFLKRQELWSFQKVAFSIVSDNGHTLFLCCGIWPPPLPLIN